MTEERRQAFYDFVDPTCTQCGYECGAEDIHGNDEHPFYRCAECGYEYF